MKRQTHDAGSEGRDHPDDSEPEDADLDAIVEALNAIYETSLLEYYTRLGEYLVEVMFDGSTEHLAERRNQTSWRKLASHEDLRESPSTLWYAVRIYAQVLDLPDGLGNQLSASQHRRLVAVKKRSDKIRLARQCVSEKWTVRQFEDEIAKLKKPSGRGGLRVPPHIKALQRLPKMLVAALEQHVTAEDIAAVGRDKMLELHAMLREHLKRLDQSVREMDGALKQSAATAEEGR